MDDRFTAVLDTYRGWIGEEMSRSRHKVSEGIDPAASRSMAIRPDTCHFVNVPALRMVAKAGLTEWVSLAMSAFAVGLVLGAGPIGGVGFRGGTSAPRSDS